MILDGWGLRSNCENNAISLADPQNFYRLVDKYPSTSLKCSGLDVGLPRGLMGNSEVGHLNMGAGRIVFQEITRITSAIEDGSFFANPEFNAAINYALTACWNVISMDQRIVSVSPVASTLRDPLVVSAESVSAQPAGGVPALDPVSVRSV